MVSRVHYLLAAAALLPACSIPGDSAWSDLHANGFAAIYPVGVDGTAHNLSVSDSSGSGLTFDGDLSVSKARTTSFFYGARVGFAPIEVSASAFGYDGAHDSAISGGATFRGESLPIDETLDATTDLEFTTTKLMVGLDIFNSPLARIGVLGGVDFMEFDRFAMTANETISVLGTPVVSSGDLQNVLVNESVPIPMLGVRADAQLPWTGLRIGGELSGLSAEVDSADISFLDMDVNLNYEPTRNVEVMVGYRRIDVDVSGTIEDAVIDFEMLVDGPYFGVSLYW